MNPSSDNARTTRFRGNKEHMFDETKIINKFSNFTSDTLYANLTTLNNQIIANNVVKSNRNRAWNTIMRYLSPVAKGDLISRMEKWASINNVQLRLQEKVKWTAKEEAQVRAFDSAASITAGVGDKSLEQTRKKYKNLKYNDKKRKAAANAGETKKKRKSN